MPVKASIYKIVCKDENVKDIYVGSTTNFNLREYFHDKTSKNANSKEYNFKKNVFIRNNGGFENFKMKLIKEAEFENKTEMRKEEQLFIRELGATLNDKRAYITDEDRAKDRIIALPKKREHWKHYYAKNKEKIKEKKKIYREQNKEKIDASNKKWREANREHINGKIDCPDCNKTLSRSSMSKHKRFFCIARTINNIIENTD